VSAAECADVVIIGSGFGGAVAACRLSSPSRKVVVLERGRDWSKNGGTPQGPRDYIYSSRMPSLLNGWLDIRFLDQMMVATGAGVGGGSLIYANVCIKARDVVFQSGWPSQITAAEMRQWYKKVDDVLQPKRIPENQLNPRVRLLQEAASNMGLTPKYETLPLAVRFDEGHAGGPEPWNPSQPYADGTCTHCGECVIGCTNGAKKTLDQNYLREAKADGKNDTEIRTLSMVTHIEEGPDGAWRVKYLKLDEPLGRRKREIVGKVVIVAIHRDPVALARRLPHVEEIAPCAGSRMEPQRRFPHPRQIRPPGTPFDRADQGADHRSADRPTQRRRSAGRRHGRLRRATLHRRRRPTQHRRARSEGLGGKAGAEGAGLPESQ
jgi:cholesterol oxidase